MITAKAFNTALDTWFQENKRTFPWRTTKDPYAIWISEIMSQQTQIERVAQKFYPRFLERYPNIESLAKTTWDELYPYWKGLGFYRRGKNMIRCAQIITEKHNGEFPRLTDDLVALPGVGFYTAHAIKAFAFNEKVPALDTNLEKIITVLWPESNIKEKAAELVKASDSGFEWNSAMMDLVAFLRKRNPLNGDLAKIITPEIAQQFLPQPKVKKPSPKKLKRKGHVIEVGIACIHRNGQYLVQTRPAGKSFTGSWEFPGGKREKGENFRDCVKREIQEEIGIDVSVRPHFLETVHQFESTTLVLRFHRCQIQAGEPKPLEKQTLAWIRPDQFNAIGFLKTNAEALQRLKEFR